MSGPRVGLECGWRSHWLKSGLRPRKIKCGACGKLEGVAFGVVMILFYGMAPHHVCTV